MAVDHSLTYTNRSFRNIGHRSRLKALEKEVRNLRAQYVFPSLADFGCSNGYLTAFLAEWSGATEVYGFDVVDEHLRDAQYRLPQAHIAFFDLNRTPTPLAVQASLVCCLETLEHTGDLSNALHNVLNSISTTGVALISVPIEIGPIGMGKFILKTLVYRDSLAELPHVTWHRYFLKLLAGQSISVFRDQRTAWSTHLGFDWRDIDDLLQQWGVPYQAKNKGTARIYTIPWSPCISKIGLSNDGHKG